MKIASFEEFWRGSALGVFGKIFLSYFLLMLFCFVSCEFWLRAQYDHIEKITGLHQWKPSKTSGKKGYTYHWDQYHPQLGWINLPGYQSDSLIPFKVHINSQGIRGQKHYASKAENGIYRVAMFGDSCVFGDEVHDNETLPYHLEQQLESSEVLNFGVHSYGLGQMMQRMELEVPKYHPNHIVFVLLLPSDLGRDLTDQYTHPKPLFSLERGELRILNVPVPHQSRQAWWIQRSFVAAWLFGRPKTFTKDNSARRAVAVARGILKRVQKFSERMGSKLTVVYLVSPDTMGARSMSLAKSWYAVKETQGTVVDTFNLIPHLSKLSKSELRRWRQPFGHWSSDANQWIAKRLAQHLSVSKLHSKQTLK